MTSLDNVSFAIDAATCRERQGRAARRARDDHADPQGGQRRLHPPADRRKEPDAATDVGNGHKVTVSFDESVFSNGVLWQQDAESFVCMEPWNGWANSVNEDGRHEELNPGESKEFKWSVTIE